MLIFTKAGALSPACMMEGDALTSEHLNCCCQYHPHGVSNVYWVIFITIVLFSDMVMRDEVH